MKASESYIIHNIENINCPFLSLHVNQVQLVIDIAFGGLSEWVTLTFQTSSLPKSASGLRYWHQSLVVFPGCWARDGLRLREGIVTWPRKENLFLGMALPEVFVRGEFSADWFFKVPFSNWTEQRTCNIACKYDLFSCRWLRAYWSRDLHLSLFIR